MAEEAKDLPTVEPIEAPEAPEAFKWVPWAAHHAHANREAFMKPAVWILIVLIALVGYRVGSDQSGKVDAAKDERIKLITEQRDDYKEKLRGASPDQAATKIDALEKTVQRQQNEIDIMLPKGKVKMSAEQRSFLEKNLNRIRKDTVMLYVASAEFGKSVYIANDFMTLLFKNKIPTTGLIGGYCESDEHGLIFELKDPSKPSSTAEDFMQLLREASFQLSVAKWNDAPDIGQDFALFFVTKFL